MFTKHDEIFMKHQQNNEFPMNLAEILSSKSLFAVRYSSNTCICLV